MADQRVITTKKPADYKAKAPTKAPIIDIQDESEPISVALVGKTYVAHMPKSMLAIRLGERISGLDTEDVDAIIDSLSEFMRLIFDAADASAILDRLTEPDDRLDIPHLLRLVDRMTEVVANRPPM